MTFDSNISTTWGGALADLRDKVSGMANWTLKKDSSGGATELTDGDWFVLTTPTGEDYRIFLGPAGGTYSGVTFEHGPDFDAGTDSWNDRYANDPRSQIGNDGYNDEMSFAPHNGSGMDPTDTGNYWLEYVDGSGFGFYFERSEGDGNDDDVFFGLSQINKTWDYTTADNRESEYVVGVHGSHYDRDYNNENQRMWTNFMPESSGAQASSTQHGFGLTNPDANFGNYPTTDSVVCSRQYENQDGNQAIIGTHDLWVRDASGGESAHQDTIQDSGGSNLYTILKAHSYGTIALGMN